MIGNKHSTLWLKQEGIQLFSFVESQKNPGLKGFLDVSVLLSYSEVQLTSRQGCSQDLEVSRDEDGTSPVPFLNVKNVFLLSKQDLLQCNLSLPLQKPAGSKLLVFPLYLKSLYIYNLYI